MFLPLHPFRGEKILDKALLVVFCALTLHANAACEYSEVPQSFKACCHGLSVLIAVLNVLLTADGKS